MLHPIKTRQDDDQQRLWFSDTNHDLFVWLDDKEHVVSFQFSYNKLHNEHIIVWDRDKGYSHDKIDNGEVASGHYKMTPIMIPDGEADFSKLSSEFKHISSELDPSLADFIYQQLSGFSD